MDGSGGLSGVGIVTGAIEIPRPMSESGVARSAIRRRGRVNLFVPSYC